MKDYRGYEERPLDWQDELILWVCLAVALFGLLIVLGII
jgi:hypothetical protein